MTYSVTIVFVDGTMLQIDGASDFGLDGAKTYYVQKNGYNMFFNPTEVKYIGRTFDLSNKS